MMSVLPPPKWRGTFDDSGNLEICVSLRNPLFVTIWHKTAVYECSVGSAQEQIDILLPAASGNGEELRLLVRPSERQGPGK